MSILPSNKERRQSVEDLQRRLTKLEDQIDFLVDKLNQQERIIRALGARSVA